MRPWGPLPRIAPRFTAIEPADSEWGGPDLDNGWAWKLARQGCRRVAALEGHDLHCAKRIPVRIERNRSERNVTLVLEAIVRKAWALAAIEVQESVVHDPDAMNASFALKLDGPHPICGEPVERLQTRPRARERIRSGNDCQRLAEIDEELF